MLHKLFMWRKEICLSYLETWSSTALPLWNYCDLSFMSFSNLRIIRLGPISWRAAVPTLCPGGLSVAESSIIKVSSSVLGNRTEQRKDLCRVLFKTSYSGSTCFSKCCLLQDFWSQQESFSTNLVSFWNYFQ